jgi:hypothetical protein
MNLSRMTLLCKHFVWFIIMGLSCSFPVSVVVLLTHPIGWSRVAKIETIETKQREYNRRLRKTSKWFKSRIFKFLYTNKHILAQHKFLLKNLSYVMLSLNQMFEPTVVQFYSAEEGTRRAKRWSSQSMIE